MKALSVSELNSQLSAFLKEHFRDVFVEGEICNYTLHPSGHSYFSIKDSESSIKCVLFSGSAKKLKIKLSNDLKVQIHGSISFYEKRGECQIICTSVTQCGVSMSDFEKIKQKLDSEGLFKKEHKKPLPKFPRKIAVITSKSGAALQDILFVAQRWNLTKLVVFNTLVQGTNAKNEIVENIKLADNGAFDIIVLTRGGGSFEDLWAFNEEIVARAIFNAKTPIVSAVGHEIDFLISDFVADVRAPTPSAAFEMILPNKTDWLIRLDEFHNILSKNYATKLGIAKSELSLLESKISIFQFDYEKLQKTLMEAKLSLSRTMQHIFRFKSNSINQKDILDSVILRILKAKLLECNEAKKSLNTAMEQFLRLMLLKVTQSKAILEASNPSNALKNGFVQITKDNKITSLSDLHCNDNIVLSDGKISKNAVVSGEVARGKNAVIESEVARGKNEKYA